MIAVVAPEDDDRLFAQLQAVERIKHAPDLGIGEGDARPVGAAAEAALLVREFVAAFVIDRRFRDVIAVAGLDLGERNLVRRRIEIEILLRRDIRRVRLVESDGEEERLVLVLLHEFDRFVGDFAVGVIAVRALRREP